MQITALGERELLALDPHTVRERITTDDVLHMARTLGAFWAYDYKAAEAGRVGMHARLKSGLHSDGFFVSKILLRHDNIASLLAHQMVMMLRSRGVLRPEYVAGIPDGASILGKQVARIFRTRELPMHKVNGRIQVERGIGDAVEIVIVEDFCTRGTGFIEAVHEIQTQCPLARIIRIDPVIINRGGLEAVEVPNGGHYPIAAIATQRINDYRSEECPLCARGSVAIKPKESQANWEAICSAQIA